MKKNTKFVGIVLTQENDIYNQGTFSSQVEAEKWVQKYVSAQASFTGIVYKAIRSCGRKNPPVVWKDE